LVWKIRSKFSYEKRRIERVFNRSKANQLPTTIKDRAAGELVTSKKLWSNQDLIELTEGRLKNRK
jgi:hypothetical protein